MKSQLQVLIVTKGQGGIERIARCRHPHVPGVEYLVSWQDSDMSKIPEELKERSDFKIYPTDSIGISHNRNAIFKHATADYLLLSDDDLNYSCEGLKGAIKSFEENPEYSFLTFKYSSETFPKRYPEKSFDFNGRIPKGYYHNSIEIGINLKAARKFIEFDAVLKFNPNFGINGTHFISGEEDIFIERLKRYGHKGKFIPLVIAEHAGDTTGTRMANTEPFIRTKGAVMLYLKPRTWLPRMIAHALRARKEGGKEAPGFLSYCLWWLKGVKEARKFRVFYQ